ncbi:MAG: hypothetical protein IJ482_06160 [Alphaproteobacteria bacterium]|nr:hypothetical protein [Alphaproteobacteria bacterium]
MNNNIYQFLRQKPYCFLKLSKNIILGIIWFFIIVITLLEIAYDSFFISAPRDKIVDIALLEFDRAVRVIMLVLFSVHFFISRRVMTYLFMAAFIVLFYFAENVPGISDAHNSFLD